MLLNKIEQVDLCVLKTSVECTNKKKVIFRCYLEIYSLDKCCLYKPIHNVNNDIVTLIFINSTFPPEKTLKISSSSTYVNLSIYFNVHNTSFYVHSFTYVMMINNNNDNQILYDMENSIHKKREVLL